MQPYGTAFREEFSNSSRPAQALSLSNISFVLEVGYGQPIDAIKTCEQPVPLTLPTPFRSSLESELAEYVEQMAGTTADLDATLEAASVEHILSQS